MKTGHHHSPATRAKIAAKLRARYADPEARKRIGERTREAMASPIVRERIKRGMSAGDGRAAELVALVAAWNAARSEVRGQFLAKILGRLGADRDAWTVREIETLRAPIDGGGTE